MDVSGRTDFICRALGSVQFKQNNLEKRDSGIPRALRQQDRRRGLQVVEALGPGPHKQLGEKGSSRIVEMFGQTSSAVHLHQTKTRGVGL